MSIRKNAIDSISIGLEDFNSKDPKRLLSATRNLFAGILLLFKHKLSVLSPNDSDEALLKEKVLPTLSKEGKIHWKGTGKKTVNVQQIKERFKALDINIEWKRFDAVKNYRNNIEHYFSIMSEDSVKKLITDSFIIIHYFISKYLGEDPKEMLGEQSWNTLISIRDVYEKEKEDCIQTIRDVCGKSNVLIQALKEFTCDRCGSGFVFIPSPKEDPYDNEFKCKSCGKKWDFETIVIESLKPIVEWSNYYSIKEGDNQKIVFCPQCGKETYIVDERRCALCGAETEHTCRRCAMEILPEELYIGGYCGFCEHMMNKDD